MTSLVGFRQWLRKKRRNRVPELGPRELEVLARLWVSEPTTAADLVQNIGAGTVTLSTVQSTLERLHRKGLVLRRKEGRAFVYVASLTRTQLISQLLGDIAAEFGDGDPAPLFSGFADFVAHQDPDSRRDLVRLLANDEDETPHDD